MIKEQKQVKEFHTKFGFAVDELLRDHKDGSFISADKTLYNVSRSLSSLRSLIHSQVTKSLQVGDCRLFRVSKLIEELGELSDSMSQANKVGAADGLGDLMYVILGTAVVYSIPMHEVFQEIHKSNMTKNIPDLITGSMKGDNYISPDIVSAINNGEERTENESL